MQPLLICHRSSQKEHTIKILIQSYQKFKSPTKTEEDKPVVQSDLFSTNLKDIFNFSILFSAPKTEDKHVDVKDKSSDLFSAKTEETKTEESKTEEKPEQSNPFSTDLKDKSIFSSLFSAAKTEEKPEQSNPFLTNLKDKPTFNSLFSAAKTEEKPEQRNPFSTDLKDKSIFNSLFSSKTEDNLFSAIDKNSEQIDEPQNSLFRPAQVSTNKIQPRPEKSYVFFSENSQNTTSSQTLLPDDPIKKKAMLFLNKLESDVTFNVSMSGFVN